MLLAEGGDLTVRNGRVMIRTVEGLRPISVLWRRQDAASCDPLELDESSRLGAPGLVDAVRQRQVSVVNALGTGILETRAFMAFLPQISEALVGAPLPLCSCGVVPAAFGLRRAGASRGSTVSFLVATPETGVDSVAVSHALLGPLICNSPPFMVAQSIEMLLL